MACTIKFKDGTEMPEAEFYAWAMDNIDLKEFAKTGNVVFINKKEQAAQFSAIKKLAYNLQRGFQALFGNKVEIITDTEEIDRVLAGDQKGIKKEKVAWHGTPHKVGKFSTEFIGTGEGAQAFGWGLYFTDLEDIADKYRSALSRKENYELWLADTTVENKISQYYDILDKTSNLDRYDEIQDRIFFLETLNETWDYNKAVAAANKPNTIAWANKNVKPYVSESLGRKYKVSLHKGKTPDQYTWLEWDKPVSKNIVASILSKLNLEKSGLYVDFLETKEKQEKVNAEIRELEKEGNKIINENKATNEEISEYLNKIRSKKAELKYTEINQKAADLSNQLRETRLGRNFVEIVENGLNGGDFYKFLEDISPEWKEGVSYDFNDQRGAKWVSLFLLENGIDGVKYPAESIATGATSDTARGFNYVVFDENAITIEEEIQFMRDPKGKVLGFVYEGKIYIDPRTAYPTTPIHEFGHIWNQYMKENHKAFYNRGIKLIKEEGGAYIEKVKKLYPELAEKGREADLYEEALAQAIGDKGALLAKQDQPSFLSWLKDMWKLVKDGLKLSVSAEALSKMTLNDYTNLVAGSMLKGSEIATLLKAERTSQASTNPKFVKNAVKNLIAVKEKVTVSLSELMGKLYKAESKGYANAVRTMKAREAAKKQLQAAAEKFLKERGIPITAEMKIEIAKIKDELSYANTMMKLIDMDNAAIRLIQIGRIKKLVKELKKLKKNKSKLTSSDINFIRDTEFPSPYEISDLDGYEKVLGDLISSLSSQTLLGVKNRFDNFIQQEAEYIKAYKEAIGEIKKMIQTAEWKEEYKQLKESGMFEGTDITSENDWIDLKESLGNIDKAEKAQERLDSLEEKFNENTKLLAEMKAATKELMESNKKELVESFKDFNDTSTPLSYEQIYNLIDSLGYNQLVKLGNIIDNVLNDYDFTGIGDYASLGRLNTKSDSLFKQLAGRVMRGVKIDPAKKMSIQQLISEISYAGDSINKALDFILGDWNSMISRVKKVYDKAFSDYEGLKNALADKNDKNKKDAIFKSTVRIDTFAFINQWFKSDTEEQQNAHLRDRVKAMADQHIRFLKNFRLPNPSLSDKIRIKKATEGLKALQEFGVIEDLDLENLTYKLNEGTTKEALQGKLNSKELKLYDYLINTFKKLSNFQNAMAMNMNKPYDEVENYFPTFPKKIDSSVEQASIEDMKAAFQRISKSNARAKGRSRQIANGKYEYNSGLTENFSKGYWEALMIDLGSNQMLDMSNMINSKFGLQKLTEAGLTPQVISIIKERLNEKATTDVAYGNINTNVDNAVSLEFERAFNNGVIGMILKNPKQMLKQGVAPFLTNLIMKPKSSAKAVEMLLNGGRYAKAVDNLLDKSTIQSRLILYQLNPVDLGVPAEYMLEEGKKRFAILKKTQEVQERWGDLVYPILKKIGVYKGNYTNLLASTDAYVSKMNILTGYIDHQMKKGKTIEQIIKDLEENKIDSVSLQNAERWQSDMNAESVRSNVAPMLRQNSGGWKYFMKTFPFTTHQSFKQGVRKLMELKSEELSGDEKKDLFDMIAKFAVQQILYRATVDVGITLIAMAIEKGLSDDEDDDDEYFWNELLSKSGGQFLFDLAFGSKSIMADVGYAIALNIAWKAWASSELEKRQSEEVGFKSKALEGNLMIEPQMGGVSGVVGREAGKVYSKLEKGFKKQEPWSDIAFQTSIGIIPPVTSIAFGSGSVRQALNTFQSREEKEYRMSNLLDAKLATEIPDLSFSVSDDDRKSIIEILRSRDYNEAKSSLFISEGIDGNNKLFLIPKESYKKLQQDALVGLFGTASTSIETIAKSKKAATLSDEKIKNFAEKYKLSNKDYKFIKVSYGNRVLDADAIKNLVSQMVSKIAKEDVLKKIDRKYSIYTYKLEK